MTRHIKYWVLTFISLSGSWDWIKNLLSLVPEADSKIVQLDLLGVAVVFFSFISYLQICFCLYIFITTNWPACLYRLFSLAWAFLSGLVPSGPKCVSARSDQLNKQTNTNFSGKYLTSKFYDSAYLRPMGCVRSLCTQMHPTYTALMHMLCVWSAIKYCTKMHMRYFRLFWVLSIQIGCSMRVVYESLYCTQLSSL